MVQDRQPPLDVFVGRAAELAQLAEVVTYQTLRALPFLASTEQELAPCHLPTERRPARRAAEQPAAI
jgi:hypothetical protein